MMSYFIASHLFSTTCPPHIWFKIPVPLVSSHNRPSTWWVWHSLRDPHRVLELPSSSEELITLQISRAWQDNQSTDCSHLSFFPLSTPSIRGLHAHFISSLHKCNPLQSHTVSSSSTSISSVTSNDLLLALHTVIPFFVSHIPADPHRVSPRPLASSPLSSHLVYQPSSLFLLTIWNSYMLFGGILERGIGPPISHTLGRALLSIIFWLKSGILFPLWKPKHFESYALDYNFSISSVMPEITDCVNATNCKIWLP